MEQSILHNGMALRNKASPPRWKGVAKKSHSVTKDWLCFAKPIIINIHTGLLRSKVNLSQRIGFAKQSRSTTMEIICEAIPIFLKGLVLRSKASPSQRIGLALRSKADRSTTKVPLFKAQPIAINDWLFAKQSQYTSMERLCEAKPFTRMERLCEAKPNPRKGMALRSKASPSQWKEFARHNNSVIEDWHCENLCVTQDWICEAKPIHHDGKALRSKANP